MRILITAGPTREYLDDVRYLSNASSGQMGYALARSAIAAGHEVALVSGPVTIAPPAGCELYQVETTDEMFAQCETLFADCDGVIGTAAVCDYRIKTRKPGKIAKTGEAITLELVETIDVLAELGTQKGDRWVMGFALESQDARFNAVRKLYSKKCDAIVLNSVSAIGSSENFVEVIDQSQEIVATYSGEKSRVADSLIEWIQHHLAGT
ncbi:phosphopantothenoylcysteine decarboxylase [Gimesia sp.]|uniref:phosphopantothenoylcysteine decarboxylase n=1 Tax=Gimesia sp. TaxID=2024833 RepID=UPI000C583258|nr:phosphopantothenoylcysteine decarboxylase [Gimesia sp.]MAX40196.1 flavoprotein [Gimesia sp.]HAH45661.1 flavoprotein [Planctomycetaceae bacterium]HBL48108.1 flavoprotein [Planctomycetaceae bacterium]|tara:strand:+ start:2147 stop:2773 length:627 start_codon:yes stop_codon:yes gene_type:complete